LATSMTARVRALCILACFSSLTLFGCALEGEEGTAVADEGGSPESIAQGLATDMAVYTNTSLASPWQSWSWSSTVSLANTDGPLRAGSTSQIKTTVQSTSGALSLAHTTSDLAVSDYDAISFDVRGVVSSSLRLSLETLAGAGSGGAQAVVPVATTWTTQTIKLDTVKGSLTRFGKMNWLGTQSGQTFYIDNVRVLAKSASASFPSSPLAVKKNDVVTLNSSASPYALFVPNSYDASHNTPAKLLLWLHGCGGNAYGDAWSVSPGGSQSWITVSVGGRDGTCWNMDTDAKLALAALDDVQRRLNIDPRRVVIGGYSSGGNLAYRTSFFNARRFAGVIAENTAPFYGTNSSQSASIGAATWKLNIAHLAHVSDTTFTIATVRKETDALEASGFPQTRIERAGTHWDADSGSYGTLYDLRTYLLPYLNAGWVAPP